MSDKLPTESKKSEELDLVILFNLIGNAFSQLFKGLFAVLKGLFSIVIHALKPIVNNLKLVASIVILATVIGFFANMIKKPIYYSEMLVKPYFESKYKLSNNVNYFNALIESKNIKELVRIFEIDSVKAESLIQFEMALGPETENVLLQQYDVYLKSLDSTVAAQVSYEDYINNRDLLAGDVFSITAKSFKKDVFLDLEIGFQKTFENPYSKKLMKIRDETIQIRMDAYKIELKRLDSLQRIYLDLLKEESENNSFSLSNESMFPLQLQRTATREYDLFTEELEVRRAMRDLDQELIEESVFYDVVAGFEEEGSEDNRTTRNYLIMFPILSFALMAIGFIVSKSFVYIKNYES